MRKSFAWPHNFTEGKFGSVRLDVMPLYQTRNMRGIDFGFVSTNFQLDFGTVLTFSTFFLKISFWFSIVIFFNLISPPVFSGVRSLSFCPFSFGHCVVCSFSIYGFWLPLWCLQTFLIPILPVLENVGWIHYNCRNKVALSLIVHH